MLRSIKIGKLYRQKPNAQIGTLPQIIILTGREPGVEDWRHVEYVDILEQDKVFFSSRGYFLDRYFEITEEWHTQGL